VTIAVKDLIEAGVHYGHRASRWNPKMKPYIYGKRNLIHIIDLKETVRGILRATKYFHRVAAGGGLILFVGTKRQAVDTIIDTAARTGMPYVTERWLGGTLTNFKTIRGRLDRLEELETTLESEQAQTYSKKMLSALNRERRKIQRNLEGIRHMSRLPEAMFVIDPHREKIAVAEARKLGIKVVALMDTDCDPDLIDLPIPGNDDSMRAIELILKRLGDAIIDGKATAAQETPRQETPPRAAATGPKTKIERRGPRTDRTEEPAAPPKPEPPVPPTGDLSAPPIPGGSSSPTPPPTGDLSAPPAGPGAVSSSGPAPSQPTSPATESEETKAEASPGAADSEQAPKSDTEPAGGSEPASNEERPES